MPEASGFVFPSRKVIVKGDLPCLNEPILTKDLCLSIKCPILAKCGCCGRLTCYLGSIEKTYGTDKALSICEEADRVVGIAMAIEKEERLKRRSTRGHRNRSAHA